MDEKEIQILIAKNETLEKELKEAYNELKKRNRALEIEAALEKVRARTINMRNSTELSETSSVLFHQLKELGIHAIRTGVGIFDDDNDAMELWLTTVSDSQEVTKILDYFNLHIHPVFENIIPARQQGKSYAVTKLEGNDVRQYYQSMSTYLSQPENPFYHEKEFFYSFFFSQGALNVVTSQPLSEEECNIIIQFARVFGLIYTRFLDLQKAETQTREALRQNSLDRVRAEIASMRTADDLQHITPLIWKELETLGVPFFRCGVFIVNETEQLVHSYLSTPDGKSLAVLHLPFDSDNTTKNIVENWRQKKVYTDHWDRQQFQSWVHSMIGQGQIKEIEQYQAGDTLPESLNLQCIPFSQGMLYVGSLELLEFYQIDLVKSLADSFSVAYARYEDFKQLAEAKNHIEKTLSELKATQSQLIQSEKMASLGELTAGIAHEIQNPLNFVNNFSELNAELLEELKTEKLKPKNERDDKVEEELINTLIENEQKIAHHGKRADAIVKGMLQHSRSSSGVKEPTDMNKLTDEYLRLAYHGLRAKNPGDSAKTSFNATIKTDFDETLEKMNVIPQDMGRVILNLITNAFYAVRQKQGVEQPDRLTTFEMLPTQYEPTVWVSTKKEKDRVEIKVKDNGNGIPQNILDKIFQPFFTTKPTGQGTGLGLSLSYDIIKAHGGDIKVKSEENEGTEFIIQLPMV